MDLRSFDIDVLTTIGLLRQADRVEVSGDSADSVGSVLNVVAEFAGNPRRQFVVGVCW